MCIRDRSSIPYVRAPQTERDSQHAGWSFTMFDFFRLTDRKMTKKLMKEGIIKNYDHCSCPVC
eukprot:13607001-Alexandrium_andersonii.AAC.1